MVRYAGAGGGTQDRNIVLDLQHNIASILITKYVPKYNTKVVSRYVTKYKRLITALTVNYLLNGQVVTQVVIPTRIVMQESGGKGGQPNNANNVVRARRRHIRTVPKNIRQLQQLMV